MQPSTILITGGLGFIFSHVTEYFVAKGWRVIVIDNLSEGSHPEILNNTFTHYNYDVANYGVIELIQKENPDFVVHAAANSDVDHSIKNPQEIFQKNILGTLFVFEACRVIPNLKKFIYVSTDEVYGECEHRKREDEIIFPKNPYSCSKAAGSLLRMAYDNTYSNLKDKTAETRFCNVFGPRQDIRKIMPLIKKSIEEGHSIPLHCEGVGYREYLYVKNIPPVIELILKKGNRNYNLTLNDGFTVKGLVKKAEEITKGKVKTHPAHRPGMDLKYQMDNTRIKDLGWKPLYSFEEGLREYLCEK
ncbi:GDP-mannose 4,6-dehydratase [Patescibacteria group bacterium]|nr:GDP-mannose 4,6-dehydratase [Patescibacteria group bacterium]